MTNLDGEIVETYDYGPYGELLSENKCGIIFLYNGELGVATDSNGLYYMRARYYNPEIKRFINQDVMTGSITNSPTLNRYAYVNGNPISLNDPFGLSPMLKWQNRTLFKNGNVLKPNNQYAAKYYLVNLKNKNYFTGINQYVGLSPKSISFFECSPMGTDMSSSIEQEIVDSNSKEMNPFEEFWDNWKIGARDFISNHRDGVRYMKNDSENLRGTLSLGGGGSIDVGCFSYSISSAICLDLKGNIGFQRVLSTQLKAGVKEEIGITASVFGTVTNSNNISELSDFGMDFGYGPVSLNFGIDDNQNITNKGVTVSPSVELKTSSNNAPYAQWDNTDIYQMINVYDELIEIDDKLLRWLNE